MLKPRAQREEASLVNAVLASLVRDEAEGEQMSQNQFRVSPSKLGALCGLNPCRRCYWLLLRMKHRTPFNFGVPGVMFGLDSQQKQIAKVMLEEGGLPKYFGSFSAATELLDIPAVSGYHADTRLSLYGKPDLVLLDERGSVLVIDNKTAKMKPNDDPLTAKYIAQTNFYGFVLENCPEAWTVERVGILYYQFEHLTDEEIPSFTKKDHILARFRPVVQEVEYDPQKFVVPLLEEVRELLDEDAIPEGKQDCKDCKLLDEFQDLLTLTDTMMPTFLSRREQQEWMATAALRGSKEAEPGRQHLLDCLPALGAPGGVLQAWIDGEGVDD